MDLKMDELQSLKSFLAGTPERVREMASGLSEAEARWKPSPQEFSALEQVCHLSDLEREGYGVRIEKLTREVEPFLPDFDGNRVAAERDYNRQSLEAMLDAFARARQSNMLIVSGLSAEDFARGGTLETVGHITLETLLVKMREHDEGHLEELKSLRHQLGK
jgi:DinB superfamily